MLSILRTHFNRIQLLFIYIFYLCKYININTTTNENYYYYGNTKCIYQNIQNSSSTVHRAATNFLIFILVSTNAIPNSHNTAKNKTILFTLKKIYYYYTKHRFSTSFVNIVTRKLPTHIIIKLKFYIKIRTYTQTFHSLSYKQLIFIIHIKYTHTCNTNH